MIHTGDCVEVMAGMEAASVDAIVTDPPYGLEFMGKEWDTLETPGGSNWSAKWTERPDWRGNTRRRPGRLYNSTSHETCQKCRKQKHQHDATLCPEPEFVREWHKPRQMQAQQAWHQRWAIEAFRIAKPGAYLLAFGGTRTYHRMTCAIEDAGWIIRDCLVWAYASGFPKSKALLKPAWEPIVMARKPGPLRELAIDACRIPSDGEPVIVRATEQPVEVGILSQGPRPVGEIASANAAGRWPANLILTDPIFDGDTPGVVGGGDARTSGFYDKAGEPAGMFGLTSDASAQYDDTGTYSRFFLVPKSDRSEREPLLDPFCNCETVKLRAWQRRGRSQPDQMASTSPVRATSAAKSEDVSDLPTTLFGNSTSDPSEPASRSTTSTVISRTTGSPTSSLSIPSPTSDSTPAARSSTGSGGSSATSAASSDPSTPNGGTSPLRDGRSTVAAVPVTSPRSLKRSVCERCGKGVAKSGERFNAHPT